jgi:2,4-dienoyl-CoA reductase-like NADH-dependent reductase (Old Yellow Enzyme family)
MSVLGDPLSLPCGATLANRLAKSAMTEGLADRHGRATRGHQALYSRWAQSSAGLLITGNVQVDREAMERPGNLRVEGPQSPTALTALRSMAAAGTSGGDHLWAQIAHAGRQADPRVCPSPLAPSAVPLDVPGFPKRPRAMTEDQIVDVIARFAHAAEVLRDCGFTGVQVHGAHGYLVSQFLSPLSNVRDDAWGGPLEHRARFLLEVLRAIRAAVGEDFPVALKLNSADFQQGGFTHADCLQLIRLLNEEKVDLLEITGGTYEQPSFFGVGAPELVAHRQSTQAREGYFASYAAAVREVATMPVMATGGFRSAESILAAVDDGVCDVVGLARPMCVTPDAPRRLLDGAVARLPTPFETLRLSEVSRAGLTEREAEAAEKVGQRNWLYMLIFDMADGLTPHLDRPLDEALRECASREDATAAALV